MEHTVASLRTSPFGVSIQRGKKRKSVFWCGITWRIQSLSHDLAPADGTRPQPMPTEIKTTLLRLPIYLSGRDWNTGWSRGVKKLFCRTLRDFRASLERRLIAVNRDSYVVLASLSTDAPSKN